VKQINHVIRNKAGLHARPAGCFVNEVIKYYSKVTVRKNTIIVNGKNIMEVMALAAGYGDQITIQIDGVDEVPAFRSLTKFVNEHL